MGFTLQHKRALITDGSRGIGAAIVKRLAQEGAPIDLTYVSKPDQAQETAKAALTIDGGFTAESSEQPLLSYDMQLTRLAMRFGDVTASRSG